MPIKTGAGLPGTCAVGQIFFLTSAPAGANLFGCTAANNWSAQGGQPGAGATLQGTLASMPTTCTVGQTYFATDAPAGANLYGCSAANASNGVAVGSRPTTNFLTGAGLISVITDTGTEINIQSALDTAVVATLPSEQSGSSLLCASATGSATTYGCAMTPTATSYTVGMALHWVPDVNGAGGPTTLNVDTLGAASVKLADGVSDPSDADIVAGSMREVWYDGVNFRFPGTGSGPVQSVFGRTGAVTASLGDYTAQQVTNAAATNSSNTFTAGTQDFSEAAHTRPTIVVSSSGNLPVGCAAGELAFVSGAAAGQQIYECSAPNTWTQQSGGGAAAAPVFGSYSSRPACNNAAKGTFFWASDISYKKWICDGVNWQPVAFDMHVVEPTALPWAGASSGADTPTITNVAGALQFSAIHASANAGEAFQITTPISLGTPYTIEVAFTFQTSTVNPTWYNTYCAFGVAGSQASSAIWDQMVWAAVPINAGGNVAGPVTLYTTNSPRPTAIGSQPVIRAQMVDDGTHRTWYTNTGSGYQQFYQEVDSVAPATPAYWGISCAVADQADQFQLTLYHASVHH